MAKFLKAAETFFEKWADDGEDFKKDKEGYGFYAKFFSKTKHSKAELSNVFGYLVNFGVSSIIKKNKLLFYDQRGGSFGKHEKEFFTAISTHLIKCGEMDDVIAIHTKWDAVEAA